VTILQQSAALHRQALGATITSAACSEQGEDHPVSWSQRRSDHVGRAAIHVDDPSHAFMAKGGAGGGAPMTEDGMYVGSADCGQCHRDVHLTWRAIAKRHVGYGDFSVV
jgi:hypothetical protein